MTKSIPHLRDLIGKDLSVNHIRMGGYQFDGTFRLQEIEVKHRVVYLDITAWQVGHKRVDSESTYFFNLNFYCTLAHHLVSKVLKLHYIQPYYFFTFTRTN
jgi:hypothetical protein